MGASGKPIPGSIDGHRKNRQAADELLQKY